MSDPKKMTEAQRTEEICTILAQGVIRAHTASEEKEPAKPCRTKNQMDEA
jgi:hypothetical protein